MKILVDNRDCTKAILLSETDEEYRILKYMMSITWGFYSLKDTTISAKSSELELALIGKYPHCTGIARLRSPKGFVEKDLIAEEADRTKRLRDKIKENEKIKDLFSHLINK